jgi:hypothetical protein
MRRFSKLLEWITARKSLFTWGRIYNDKAEVSALHSNLQKARRPDQGAARDRKRRALLHSSRRAQPLESDRRTCGIHGKLVEPVACFTEQPASLMRVYLDIALQKEERMS